jgi:hypothetical protein
MFFLEGACKSYPLHRLKLTYFKNQKRSFEGVRYDRYFRLMGKTVARYARLPLTCPATSVLSIRPQPMVVCTRKWFSIGEEKNLWYAINL